MVTVTNNSPQAINTSLFSLEKEIQEMLKRVERIKGDLDGLDVGVVSVNDKTGKVELTAEDVGALPSDTHIPADQVQSNWTETDTSSLAYIENKPNLATVATSGSYSDLSNKPTIPAAQVNSDWNATSGVARILNKPSLATVATSGNYNDLSNKPSLATVATSGSYSDLSNKPTIPTATSQLTNDSDFVTSSGRVANATYADTFRATYISYITPAQAAAMVSNNTSWPLTYGKDYLQTVSVGWENYQQHNFPAGAAGYFFPGYGSNGGTLVLVNYPSNRMLYNVWIDSNRWSGWHYIDLSPVTYS